MKHQEQLQWEARAGRPAAIAAFVGAALTVFAGLYLPLALPDRPDGADEFLQAAHDHSGAFIISGALQALSLLLLAVALGFLYRVTKYRRKELVSAALVLLVGGALVGAIVGVATQVERVQIADDFVKQKPEGPSPATLNSITDAGEYLDAVKDYDPEERADDFVKDESSAVLSGIGFAANLALGFALVLIGVNAMRAGTLSRFMGILGIIIGVLYVLPLLGGPQIIQLFWLTAIGVLFLNRWPGGRGPAWDSGEAEPWPTAAEMRKRMEEAQGGGATVATEPAGESAGLPAPADEPAPKRSERAKASRKKRKRKQRK